MKKITTLEEALKRIEKLEKENAELKEANADLKEELEYFKKRKAVADKDTTPNGWPSTMTLLFVMSGA